MKSFGIMRGESHFQPTIWGWAHDQWVIYFAKVLNFVGFSAARQWSADDWAIRFDFDKGLEARRSFHLLQSIISH